MFRFIRPSLGTRKGGGDVLGKVRFETEFMLKSKIFIAVVQKSRVEYSTFHE